MKIKYVTIFLVLLCCFMGAASAAEDISTDVADASIDDVVITDEAVDADLQADDSISAEPADADSDVDQSDSTIETNDEEGNTRASGTATASDWTTLRNKAQETGTDYTITLTDNIGIGSTDIIFGNNAIIDGNGKIISGNIGTTRIPFKTTTNSYSITFRNVKFQNINCQMLIKLQTNGISKIENCSFINITTGNDHHSVIYNYWGTMNITDCNFTNCTTGYGVITNHNPMSKTGVKLNVKNCIFENNFALFEPGAINNCGQLNVTNSTFIHNVANWWAGAIHTHTNAHTRIFDSTFTDNVAGGTSGSGWNGGALFSYSDLEVYNSIFTGNNCSVLTGGGAIFGYSMGTSTYNITVDSCNFTNNANNFNGGYAGAIGVQNIGYLTVTNSNFTNNHATYGQAIYGITKDEPYCTNCTNCSCPNCPNCTNCSHTVSTGEPNCTIVNNVFVNHTGSGDTVVIDGQRYTFNNNIFINSTQEEDYGGEGNEYGLTAYPTRFSSPALLKAMLSSSVLGDKENHDVIYVNVSSSNDRYTVDGQSWENAYGGTSALSYAIQHINNGGIIYVADGIYTGTGGKVDANYTMIGLDRDTTIFDTATFTSGNCKTFPNNYGKTEPYAFVTTYINITFKNPKVKIRGDKVFINCTFINSNLTANEEIYNYFIIGTSSPSIYYKDETYVMNFTNCDFVNYNTEGSILEAFTTSQVNFNNCRFENITANSIVNNTGEFILEDGINFKDCTFNNVNVKGIVDVATGSAFGERYTIEGCTGVDSYGIVNDGDRDYVNSTEKAEITIGAEDLTVEVNVDANLTVTLKDDKGNALANKEIIVSVGGVNSTANTDDAGVAVIPVKYDTAGEYEYTLYFAGDETNYKEATKVVKVTVTKAAEPETNDTNDTPAPKVATKLTASKVTATYNVAKKLVITLKDANGKALANKKVTVKVGTISKTLKTNSKGQVSLNVATLVPKTYTATVKFAGDSSYKASTVKPKVVVKKATPKMAAKAKTFKIKTKVKKVTATLKNNKGKVLKKVKLTLKVGKKTYTAKTNAKGVATFKVKLTKKGKYTGTVKFAGSKYYKALSKKVKITVKK